jgi:hypothetical protein
MVASAAFVEFNRSDLSCSIISVPGTAVTNRMMPIIRALCVTNSQRLGFILVSNCSLRFRWVDLARVLSKSEAFPD